MEWSVDRALASVRAARETLREPDRAEVLSTLDQLKSWASEGSATSPPLLLPLCGGVAFAEGSLLLGSVPVTMHVGGEYFISCSASHASGVLQRREAVEVAERVVDAAMEEVQPFVGSSQKKSKESGVSSNNGGLSNASSFARGVAKGFGAKKSTTSPNPNQPPVLNSGDAGDRPSAGGSHSMHQHAVASSELPAEDEPWDEDWADEEAGAGLFEIEEYVDDLGREVRFKYFTNF